MRSNQSNENNPEAMVSPSHLPQTEDVTFVTSVILLSIIVLVSVVGNLYWVQQNIVLVGHDASNYLTTTMEYLQILTDFSPQAIFRSLTYPDYRTPALYIAAQPFLWIFGANMDSAQYLNVTLSIVVITLTYSLGTMIANRSVGLFAALLVSLLPLMAAMARLFYAEMLLTAVVITNLMALHKSDRFANRPWSHIWGISLGVGLLVKWTMPIYIGLPLLWSLWQMRSDTAGSWRRLWHWRRFVGAILLASGIAWLWYWPNRMLVEQFVFGSYLWCGWALLLVPVCYGFMFPSIRVINLITAVFFGMAIASLWYLPHSDFAIKLLAEDQARSNPAASLYNLDNYTRNFWHLYYSNFGSLAFWLIVPASLGPWIHSWWRRQVLNAAATPLWLSIASAFIALSIILQQNPRNLVPILPSVAIVATIALQQYHHRARLLLGSSWIIVLSVQLFLYTTDALPNLYAATQALWSMQGYAIQPSSGSTAIEYWVIPKILARITQDTASPQRLAMLVNDVQIHRGVFKYQISVDNLAVKIIDVTEIESMGWYDMFSATWVLLKDGDNHNVEPQGLAIINRIFAGDTVFHALYTIAETYNLPNGERLYLYQRTKGPGRPHDLPIRLADTHGIARWIKSVWQPGVPIIYSTPDVAVWVGIHDPVQAPASVLDPEKGNLENQFPKISGTAFVVFDQESTNLQSWLNHQSYYAGEYGNDHAWVTIFGFAETPPDVTTIRPRWSEIELNALRTEKMVTPGAVLPIEIDMAGMTNSGLKLSLRLVAPDNTAIATQDRPIVEIDRFGLFVPPGSIPGNYRLIAFVYDPTTMNNIPTDANSDEVTIGTVDVVIR